MRLSPKAQNIYKQITSKTTRLGDIRNIAKDIKKDHELAMELWSTGEYLPNATTCATWCITKIPIAIGTACARPLRARSN